MPGFYDDDDDDDDFFFFLLKKNLAKALLDRACVKWLYTVMRLCTARNGKRLVIKYSTSSFHSEIYNVESDLCWRKESVPFLAISI